MADKQTDNARFEQFKQEVLAWKEEHRDEYNRFSRMMAESDGMEFVMLYKSCTKLLPAFVKEWKSQWSGDGTIDFGRFDTKVQSSKLAKVWVDRFHYHKEDMTANLVLSWMLFGRSYETMVTLLEGYANDEKNGRIIRTICAKAIKYIINSSIKSGYRTREQWDDFHSEQQMLKDKDATGWAMKDIDKTMEANLVNEAIQEGQDEKPEEIPDVSGDIPPSEDKQDEQVQEAPPMLADFLFCDNKERVLQAIHDYFRVNSQAKDMAYVNIAMLQMGISRKYHDEKTFYQALVNQYPDITFKALRSYRDARQKLLDTARDRHLYEVGSDANEIAYVKNMIEQAMTPENHS